MSIGETLFEQVVGERIISEREEAQYGSLPAFYALADARFKDRWRMTEATYYRTTVAF
jgi:hypothetical protein